jgi:hypothetical protein
MVLALHRARWGVLSVGLVYLASVLVGIGMATMGVPVALERRDALVAAAQGESVLLAYRRGDRLQAALLDFRGNLLLGGVTSSLVGTTVVGIYPVVAYRGWVGGIVSVDGAHRSRLAEPGEAAYYVVTLVLQLIPATLAGGVGVSVGWRAWRPRGEATWLGFPRQGLRDVARLYVLIAPLFLVASLWEFLAR